LTWLFTAESSTIVQGGPRALLVLDVPLRGFTSMGVVYGACVTYDRFVS
jgi:hypothetical protein